MPKFSSVDVLFKRTPEGWTFNSAYPRIFGQPWTYLLTETQKEALEERLNHVVLMSRILAFMLVVLGAFAVFIVPDFVDRLDAGSLEAWLLACVFYIVLTSVLISPAIFFMRYRVLQPTLRAARCIGPAEPDRLGFIILKERIRRYTERKSAKVLITWIAVFFLISAYGTIVYALLMSARSVLMLFAIVVLWLATLCYAALLAFKLRATHWSGR